MPLLAVLGALAVAVGAFLSASGIVSAERSGARDEVQAAAERHAARLQSRVRDVEAVVTQGDPAGCLVNGAMASVTVASDVEDTGLLVSCVARDARGVLDAPSEAPELRALLEDEAVSSALARARDRVGAVLSAPSAVGRSVLAAPLYRTRGRLSHQPLDTDLATLRSSLAGYVVALVDVEPLLGSGDRTWQVTDGGTVLAGPDELDGSVASADVTALDRRWVLRTPIDRPSWWRPEVLSTTGFALAGVVLLGVADRRRQQHLDEQAVAARRAEARAAVIATLAGIVQQSQDLDAILPAMAVRLSDELGLAGLSLAVAGPTGGTREVFVHGVPPDHDVSPVGVGVEHVSPRHTFAVDLHRAERSIAVLRVVAGTPLDAGALDVVRLAGEMVTSTIVAARSIEQQQEAVRRLESLDELKTTFLGVASNELRTPATAISGLASLLAQRWDDLPDADRHTFAERIATNANALNTLVQDLLDFARIERGDLRLAQAPVDLSTTVVALLERLGSVWSEHRVEALVEPDVEVLGDPNAIERVVTNLVSNAVKFSSPGETVQVTVAREGNHALLLVDDSGPGVPEHEREKIFVRFFRGAEDAVVRTRGVGIGLSVVQDFVAQMGGTVRVADSPAGGARFIVELPVSDRVPEEVHDVATT